MVIVESYLKKNECYKNKRPINIEGLVLRSVGYPQPSAKVLVNNWNRPDKNYCPHAIIDAYDGKVYQLLPWNQRGRHCNGNGDDCYVGIALCEPAQLKHNSNGSLKINNMDQVIAAVKRTYKSAVELFAQLCIKYHVDPFAKIYSANELRITGRSSELDSLESIWEVCGLDYTMQTFRTDVFNEMSRVLGRDALSAASDSDRVEDVHVDSEELKDKSALVEVEVPKIKTMPIMLEESKNETAVVETEEQNEYKPQIIQVRVDVDNLRIRIGPGTNNRTTGKYTGKGIFTILEIQNGTGSSNGWGRLENGEGWISLDYAIRI